MAIIVEEKFPGRRIDATSAEVVYLVTGTDGDAGNVDDEDAFNAVASSAPAEKFGLPGANIDVRQELLVGTIWEVAALYSSRDPVVYQQSSVQYEFSFQAPEGHIQQSLYTRGGYSANGPVNANMFGGAINVVNEEGKLKCEGYDIPGGSPTNTWVYNPLNADITLAYQQAVESIMGHVNSSTFKGRPIGTMRLVAVDGGADFAFGTTTKWSIRFGFQFSANRSNVNFGDILVPFLYGHDIAWSHYHTALHSGEGAPEDNGPVLQPRFIFVEQIFPYSNLNVLGI